jgi:RNA polymerase sigma factor (sigma-70 family)
MARHSYDGRRTEDVSVDVSVDDAEWLAERFEQDRARLRALAYRMLGSLAEADDAVQEAWLRLSRAGASGVDNLSGWLTTVTGRVCLDMLRARQVRREEPLGVHLPDPLVGPAEGTDPEQQALLAESVGLALLVVLQTLSPAERLAFVLHDMFAMPYEQIAETLGRSPVAARLLASRARRRVQSQNATPDPDLARQRAVVDAFLSATRDGDLEALVALLDPEVVVRADYGAAPAAAQAQATGETPGQVRGAASGQLSGADAVARQAVSFARLTQFARPVLVNGAAGIVVAPRGRPLTVMAFTVRHGQITEIDILADQARLRRLSAAMNATLLHT